MSCTGPSTRFDQLIRNIDDIWIEIGVVDPTGFSPFVDRLSTQNGIYLDDLTITTQDM